MSGQRLVEYFLVAGVDPKQQQDPVRANGDAGSAVSPPLTPLSPLSEHTSRVEGLASPTAPPDARVVGSIIQRFPLTDRNDTVLPTGVEIFCQPLGWFLTYTPSPPSCVDFVLTAEDGKRLYCTSLNFYQLCKDEGVEQVARKLTRHSSAAAIGKPPKPRFTKHMSMGAVETRKVDYLDEGQEESMTVKDVYGELFQPVSLCIISKFPLFELFQMCLKGLYIPWLSSNVTLELEKLVAELLAGLNIPQRNCLSVKKPFGALKQLILPPVDENTTLPYTSTAALWLLRRVGVHRLLQLVSAIISDFSVLFISSSLTVLNSSLRALSAIIFPFKVSHSIVPVVPADLLDYTQLPSTYIMGVHASLREQIDIDMLDVIEVYLDSGCVEIPDTINLPYFPEEVRSHVSNALARVLDPSFDTRDQAFPRSATPLPLGVKARSDEELDKEVRGIFICLLAYLLGDYQNFVTVLRFQPVPCFFFNMESYLNKKETGGDHQSLVVRMAKSISFFNFCHERSVPFRQCDFFDELVARFASDPRDLAPPKLFSPASIQELSEELCFQLPPLYPAEGPEFDMEGVSPATVDCPLKVFPKLNGEVVEERMKQYGQAAEEGGAKGEGQNQEGMKRKIPLLDSSPTHHHQSATYQRGLDSLTSCLDAMFQSKIIEARKYVPSVIQALKSGILSEELVPCLVDRFFQYGVLLSSEQFDLVVKLLNSALVDEQSALMLLPLTTVIYREVNPGVQQYACTCVQNHNIWDKLNFWRDAIYLAIQAELVRVYAEVEAEHNRKLKREEEGRLTVEDVDPEDVIGDITLRSRQRVRSSSPARLRATASKFLMTRSARMRLRASVVVPGVSEGVLPPNAKPVTGQEALHHLSKILDLWDSLPEEKQTSLMKIEENAINNQIILFVQRVIHLRTPVEISEEDEGSAEFIAELEQFISQLLQIVEVDLSIDVSKNKIREQIHDMILIHLGSMAGLRKELKRLPASKPKVIKPPLIPGEVLLFEHSVHAYLLQDGRDNGLMLPADGQIFLTSYRIIFLGTPCDPQAPSLIVTRSMPISSIYRLKKLQSTPLPPPISINTIGGLQIRSTTAELLKIGFDDETSLTDIKNLEQHIVNLRNPSSITLGVKVLAPLPSDSVQGGYSTLVEKDGTCHSQITSLSRQQFRNKANRNKSGNVLSDVSTLSRVKIVSEISQSPCCLEYERLSLGSVNFKDSRKGAWRTTTLNLSYAVCPSYPAVLVVPSKVTDESLASLAGQFQHNRWPVVTWKHPHKEAVLLRASSFVPSTITRKKFSQQVGAKFLPSLAQKQLATDEAVQNRAGVGVYNRDVENYLYGLILDSPKNRSTLDLVKQISMPPPMMEFEEELRRQGSFRGPPPSPSPSNDSAETEVVPPEIKATEPIHRNRAATYAFKIRTRVGSSVSQLSRVALPDKKVPKNSPATKRKLSTRRGKFSSPQLTRAKPSEDTISRHSSCSTASDLSTEKTKWRESLKEEEEAAEDEKKGGAKSASTSPTTVKKKTHKRTRSSDEIVDMKSSEIDLKDIIVAEKTGSPEPPMSPIDWEAVGSDKTSVKDEPYARPSTSTPEDDNRNSSPELLGSHSKTGTFWDHFSDKKSGGVPKDVTQSPGSFSTLPTNPRDWMVMDALPTELRHWQANALYILGDKAVLQDIPEDLYPNCMFVPVEVPSPSDVCNSFKKLMRACAPSAPQATYFSGVQESGWVTQLTHLMQLGGAVVDLMDIQESSVMVCLENGWDATAQVVSIAQILMDPYYRTMEGFKMLIEKDWLSFGHRFSHNGSHTSSTIINTFTPIFLQFLDVVHQILKQFPLSFEFNDFYLRTLAYHHCSMRFHTFTADSEKERYANNWLPYRPRTAHIYGSSGQTEEFVSFWEYIDSLHKESMLFYNFMYQPSSQSPLRPYSYQANIDVWSFYLDNNLSEFPSYDMELISEGPLTLLDMHHNFFEKDKSLPVTGLRIEQPRAVASEISSLLGQYTRLMTSLAMKSKLPESNWAELLEELLTSPTDRFPTTPIFPTDLSIVSHNQTLHKRTTMAVLIKGKLAVELETQFTTPHQFEPQERGGGRGRHQECSFCKHQINREEVVVKCRKCGCVCHAHCKSQMPYNCGQEKRLKRRLSKRGRGGNEGPEKSNWTRQASSVFFNSSDMPDAPEVSEGYLYKRGKIVRNWKQRWFVLDPEKGTLSYYDSSPDTKCHGTLNLRDILSVEEAEPQVVPSLKPGESGFFFNVVTQKRVFHLMALRAVERTEWMRRITNILRNSNTPNYV